MDLKKPDIVRMPVIVNRIILYNIIKSKPVSFWKVRIICVILWYEKT